MYCSLYMFVSNIIIIEVKRDAERKRDREIIFYYLIYNEFDIFKTVFCKKFVEQGRKTNGEYYFANISKITSKLIDCLFTNFIKIK